MPESRTRKPAVSGQFYSGSPQRLKEDLRQLTRKASQQIEAVACILPHAGYMYSGSIAGTTLAHLVVKHTAVLLGPNHTGYGLPFSIMSSGEWETPIGNVPIHTRLAQSILQKSRYLQEDASAHIHEHSLEVQIPFLKYLQTDIKIVPIVVIEDTLSTYQHIAGNIVDGIKELKIASDTIIIASSDMTHYEPDHSAQQKDKKAIECIQELDEKSLIENVARLNITLCGLAPIVITIIAAKLLGATQGKLIRYATSADVTKDFSSVVGYAGMVIY